MIWDLVKAFLNIIFGLLMLVVMLAIYFFIYGVGLILALSIVYFFLAAAGVVPPQDLLPLIPYL